MLEDEDFLAAGTDAEKDALTKLREATSEWMSEAGDKASKKELVAKYDELKKLVTPLAKRKEETSNRPELVENIESVLKQTGEMLKTVKEQVEKAAESSSSSTEAPASEESGESASTTSSADASVVTPSYTAEDLTELENVYDTVQVWFSETLIKQNNLKPNEDAVLTVADLKSKARQLNDALMSLVQKQMRRQQAAKASASKAAKAKSSKSSSTTKAPEASDAASDLPVDGEGVTIDLSQDGKMPSAEEIEEAIKKAREEADSKSKHDEL
jgi:hypoxia up-regulated 1